MPQARHSLWSGTVTFGLVSVPVDVVTGVRGRRSPFHMLHRSDHSRVQIRMYCEKENVFVQPEHVVRGYEIEPEKYVIVDDAEIEALEPRRSRDIEIQGFVESASIDAAYCQGAYYLVPTSAERPYQLLATVLQDLKMAGIAEFVMHARQHLVAVMSIEGALCLASLRYQDELRSPEEIKLGRSEPQARVLAKVAGEIKKHSGHFDPSTIRDFYQERIDRLIQRMLKTRQTVQVPQTEHAEEIGDEGEEESFDLVSALEESLARARKKVA